MYSSSGAVSTKHNFKEDYEKSKNVYNSTGQRYWLKQQPRYVICLYMPMHQ